MTNVSTLPKSDIVSDADLTRATAKPELAMVEVASAEGDSPFGVTGKSLKRYLRDKYHDLVVYLAEDRTKTSPRALPSLNSIGKQHD